MTVSAMLLNVQEIPNRVTMKNVVVTGFLEIFQNVPQLVIEARE
jgi:hypothetical protein